MGPIQPVLYSSFFSAPQLFCQGQLPVQAFEFISRTNRIAEPMVPRLFHEMDPALAMSLLKNAVRFARADVVSPVQESAIEASTGPVITPFRDAGLSDKGAVEALGLFGRARDPRTTKDEMPDLTLGKSGIDFLVGSDFHVAPDDNTNWLARSLVLPEASGQKCFEAVLLRAETGEEINIKVNEETGIATFKVGDNLGERVLEYQVTPDYVFQTSLSFIVPLLSAVEFMGASAPSNQQELDDFLKVLAKRLFLQQAEILEQAVPLPTTEHDYEEVMGGNIAALPYAVVKPENSDGPGYPYIVRVRQIHNPARDTLIDPELEGTEQLLQSMELQAALRFYSLQITIDRVFPVGRPVIELNSSLQALFPK